MLSNPCLHELHSAWLPNISDAGLDRLIDLLEKNSPLLIHGSFTRAVPMGCLATHIAWNHPATEHLVMDAGICWLHRVANLNPATSQIIREWDRCGDFDFDFRADLLVELKQQRQARRQRAEAPSNRVAELLPA